MILAFIGSLMLTYGLYHHFHNIGAHLQNVLTNCPIIMDMLKKTALIIFKHMNEMAIRKHQIGRSMNHYLIKQKQESQSGRKVKQEGHESKIAKWTSVLFHTISYMKWHE